MNPTATACHSAPAEPCEPGASPSSTRQRIQRMGKVSVARRTAIASGPGRAARTSRRTSDRLTPRNAQNRSATETIRPMAAGISRRAPVRDSASGVGKRKRNEVEQLLEQRLNLRQAGVVLELGGDLLA